jgi:hypothetical protein
MWESDAEGPGSRSAVSQADPAIRGPVETPETIPLSGKAPTNDLSIDDRMSLAEIAYELRVLYEEAKSLVESETL